MTPILKYPGAKWRLASWVLSHMPPHESYLEPYFGSGAVLFNKPKSRIETVNDLDSEVVNFFLMCRECPDELAEGISLTPWARDEREAAYQRTDNPIERARHFAVRCWMTFGAHPRLSNGWRHASGSVCNGGPDNPKLWARVPECVREVGARLLQVQIENRPALEVIPRFNGPEVLIYADPPYVMSTRTMNGSAYHHEMSDADHEQLIRTLQVHSGMAMLSGYDCEIYRELLKDWRMVSIRTTAERAAKRTECLWLNQAAVERLPQMEI